MATGLRIPEKVVQQQIVQALTSVGGRVWVLGTRRPRGDYQGTRQTPGLPDLIAFLPPQKWLRRTLLFVEVKAAKGRLRPEQRHFQELCAFADVEHIVGGLDAVLAWLAREGYIQPSHPS